MDDRPGTLHETWAALAAPRRFALLLLLLSGVVRSVSQLAEAVGLSQSCTTRHLQALARAGLVKGVRDGKRVVFRVAPRDDAARAVLASLSGVQPSTSAGPRPASSANADRARPRRRRRAPDGPGVPPRAVLDAAIRIEPAAEVERLVVGVPRPPHAPERAEDESGRTSEPEAEPEVIPAWQRSVLEDFLL
jgi:DNA-binding transcriptional ArsR family regulator